MNDIIIAWPLTEPTSCKRSPRSDCNGSRGHHADGEKRNHYGRVAERSWQLNGSRSRRKRGRAETQGRRSAVKQAFARAVLFMGCFGNTRGMRWHRRRPRGAGTERRSRRVPPASVKAQQAGGLGSPWTDQAAQKFAPRRTTLPPGLEALYPGGNAGLAAAQAGAGPPHTTKGCAGVGAGATAIGGTSRMASSTKVAMLVRKNCAGPSCGHDSAS
mmetsp:Transcript_120400/g.374888  ORF Transcript_120400/g.374888 Transcript_120400/m.374888 type:complete len:215 (+) Transcript_120400:32-676(+)